MNKEYQPKTGEKCSCKRGIQRDNCPACEGTGWRIDFKQIRERSLTMKTSPKIEVRHSRKVAIVTKFIPATNTKGSRVKADAGMNRSVTISYDHDCTSDVAHERAAIALCEKMEWSGKLLAGGFEDGGFVFVFED